MPAGVIDALRRFLPRLPAGLRPRDEARQRAVWAITHCRTPALGGHLHGCAECATRHFAYHSCNHRACPQCGRAATAQWVTRELGKRIAAPYFMVTFTLPGELRHLFLGPDAKSAFDLFFAASSAALAGSLASPKGPRAAISGFTGVLHTWNQRLHFHPHIHYLVPGGGLNATGRFVTVKNAQFLAPLPPLRRRFRRHFREGLDALGWTVDPAVWRKDWGIHIQPFGTGENAIKYLGAYISRTAIGDGRLVSVTEDTVTFRWKDRAQGGRPRTETLPGTEFCVRYLRHVLPRGMRSVRYFGFCHPSAKTTRERVAFLSGRALVLSAAAAVLAPGAATVAAPLPLCPCCHRPMPRLAHFKPAPTRGPPLAT
jgi:hypothetical protein